MGARLARRPGFSRRRGLRRLRAICRRGRGGVDSGCDHLVLAAFDQRALALGGLAPELHGDGSRELIALDGVCVGRARVMRSFLAFWHARPIAAGLSANYRRAVLSMTTTQRVDTALTTAA